MKLCTRGRCAPKTPVVVINRWQHRLHSPRCSANDRYSAPVFMPCRAWAEAGLTWLVLNLSNCNVCCFCISYDHLKAHPVRQATFIFLLWFNDQDTPARKHFSTFRKVDTVYLYGAKYGATTDDDNYVQRCCDITHPCLWSR